MKNNDSKKNTSEDMINRFNKIHDSVHKSLKNGGDGHSSRVINEAKYHVDEIINNKSMKLFGEVISW